jgi:tRNA pseudouridine55 synthase
MDMEVKINTFDKEADQGMFLVNKPKGKSSFWVVRQFKSKFPGLRVGHAGTLDPLAEGLLVILVGKATKLQKEFENMDKQYKTELVFGVTSSSFDLDGEIKINRDIKSLKKIDKALIKKTLEDNFFGSFVQTVPIYSAVKRKGQRLYKLARKERAEKIVLPKRQVELAKFALNSFRSLSADKPANDLKTALKAYPKVSLEIDVSKGFYVRSLVSDLGKVLGVGAVTTKLVRTRVGPYKLAKADSPVTSNTPASVDR